MSQFIKPERKINASTLSFIVLALGAATAFFGFVGGHNAKSDKGQYAGLIIGCIGLALVITGTVCMVMCNNSRSRNSVTTDDPRRSLMSPNA